MTEKHHDGTKVKRASLTRALKIASACMVNYAPKARRAMLVLESDQAHVLCRTAEVNAEISVIVEEARHAGEAQRVVVDPGDLLKALTGVPAPVLVPRADGLAVRFGETAERIVRTYPAGEIPGAVDLPADPGALVLRADGREMSNAIAAVLYAAGTMAAFPSRYGVCIDSALHDAQGQGAVVATDGYRLVVASLEAELPRTPGRAQVPYLAARALAEALASAKPGSAWVEVYSTHTRAEGPGFKLRARNAFPPTFADYAAILHNVNHRAGVTVDSESLARLLRDHKRDTCVFMHTEGGTLRLRVAPYGPGACPQTIARYSMGVAELPGGESKPLEVKVNTSFMLDALTACCGQVSFRYGERADPLMLEAQLHNDSNRSYKTLVMPMYY